MGGSLSRATVLGGGAPLEGRIEPRAARAEQLLQSFPSETEVQPEPGPGGPRPVLLARLDDPLALDRRARICHLSDDVLPHERLEAESIGDLEEQKQLSIFLHADRHVPLDVVQFQLGRVHRTQTTSGSPAVLE